MLALSASRRQRRQTSRLLAASFAQLALPWLAPAQLRWTNSHAPAATRKRRLSSGAQAKNQLRGLATSTDQYTQPFNSQLPPPGYDELSNDLPQQRKVWDFSNYAKNGLANDAPYKSPLVVNTLQRGPSAVIKVQSGLNGTAKDLLAHLHTSLNVGRQERAEAIIQRMADHCELDAPELLYAHTVYLDDRLQRLTAYNPGSLGATSVLIEMQKWFEVEIRNRGTIPNVQQLIAMVRAAAKALEGSKRDRTIRRYLEVAKQQGPDIYQRTLYASDYDSSEFALVGRATSEFSAEEESQAEEHNPREFSSKELSSSDGQGLSDDVPEVIPTSQKGSGLHNIKRTLSIFAELPQLPADAPTAAKRERAYARQRRLEETSVDIAIENWRRADADLRKLGINTAMQSKPIGALMWQWFEALLPSLREELDAVKKTLAHPPALADDRSLYGPYFELLPVDKLAATIILYTVSKFSDAKNWQSESYEQEAKLTRLTSGLVKAIEDECKATEYFSSKKQKRTWESMTRDHVKRRALRAMQGKDGEQTYESMSPADEQQRILAHSDWPTEVMLKLGAVLVSKFVETAQLPVTREHPRTGEKVTQMQPAFLHRFKYQRGKKLGVLVPNPALVEKMESEPVGSMIAKRMPMTVEPLPWKGWEQGGYLHFPTPVVRLSSGDKTGRDYIFAADARKDLDTIYKGLTALGKVPWKVNPDVFKVQLEAWNSGEEIANFAPLKPRIERPVEPESSEDPGPKRAWLSEMQDAENREAGLHSKRCFQNFQLEIARTVRNETIYFPHNLDFRGRAYPIPPYLNHMGADNVRGLLQFAEGKELGPGGLRWLQIHLATVAGHDKASLEERVQFTKDHIDDIYDSARDPLGGQKWWLKAEDAWQLLAACIEFTKAMNSPDPEKFVSHLPVQQDGTCNGLQHYAALGGDRAGAMQVNLEPGDRPADVYTAVAEAVQAEVRRDAANGNEVARFLDGHITRKCVKQPVMTNVYGVTFYGAKAQVRKQLETIFPHVKRNDDINLGHMSHYIATKIFKSLGSMFSGAQAIQVWLGQCADRISTSLSPEQIDELVNATPSAKGKPVTKSKKGPKKAAKNDELLPAADGKLDEEHLETDPGKFNWAPKPLFKSTVVWTTPLRLPVVQPYRTAKGVSIMTKMQRMKLTEPQVWDPVSKRKQLQAFPPNFIHSLDATHMLLSALKCSEVGLTFASVHDSFWTHAADVPTMSTVLRDAFVAMHGEDIIGRLREEFQARYKGCLYLRSVPAASPVGQRIIAHRLSLKAKKGSKSGKSGELALELERLQLLDSEDAAERAKGAAMTTPSSIALEHVDEPSSSIPQELVGQTLGEIPDSNVDVAAESTNAAAEDGVAPSVDAECLVDEAAIEQNHDDEATPCKTSVGGPNCTGSSAAKTKKREEKKVFVWAPLVFPDVPTKGDFDVTRLRESRYFFH